MTGLWPVCIGISPVLQFLAHPQAAISTWELSPQSQTKVKRAGMGKEPHTGLLWRGFRVEVTHSTCTHSPLVRTSHVIQTPRSRTGVCDGADGYSPSSKYLHHTGLQENQIQVFDHPDHMQL